MRTWLSRKDTSNALESGMGKYRYERKFVISGLARVVVEQIIKLHPAMFSEIYHERFVNNIYLDSMRMRSYHDNIDGASQRMKVRIRWYGDLWGTVKRPVLELKSKNGFLVGKQGFELGCFEVDKNMNCSGISEMVERSDIPEIVMDEVKCRKAMFVNRYRRKYFESENRKYRVTIDTDVTFYRISYHYCSFLNGLMNDMDVILELKYGEDMDRNADNIASFFPFRLSKNSKYVMGIWKLYGL